MRHAAWLAAALIVLASAAASAQDALPPPELGVGYGGLLVMEKGGDYTVGSTQPAIHLRLTFPFTPRFSFEGIATISNSTFEPAYHRTNGLYILQVKQQLGGTSGKRFHAFLTYGAAGYYLRLHQDAVTVARSGGATYDIGESTITQTDPPFFAAVGGGFQRELGRKVALCADAQMLTLLWMPVAVRLSAGISVPFGEYGGASASRTPAPNRRVR